MTAGENTPHLTDAGNAQVFAAEHGNLIRWVPEWATWIRYEGTRWVRTPHESIIPLAIQTARGFYARAANRELDHEEAKKLAAHARASESAGKLEAMIRLARGLLIAGANQLNRDTWALNLANGTLDLRSPGMFREHRREDMCTMLAPVSWDATATCPQWEAFLERVLPDAGVRLWLQKFVGYCLTGDVGEQILAFCHGRGANGKSTLLEILLYVLGDYGKPGAPDLLLAKHGEAHPTEQADLQGARAVVCQETEAGRHWAERTVKALTGSDTIKARFMRCDFFSFEPTHKLIVSANHKPKVRGQDEGIWRRIKLLPFEVTIPKAERDTELASKLRTEAPGILLWAVQGCLLWQTEGLGEPPAITEATATYRSDHDHLGQFVADECEVSPDAFVPTSELYAAYQSWCGRSGHDRAWTRDSFREGLLEREFVGRKGAKGVRGIGGLRVRRGSWVAGGA